MQILKRIELWILLAVVLAGLFFVFGSRHKEDDGSPDGPSAAATEDAPLKLHRSVLTRDYGNAHLDIELNVHNDSADKLVLQAPTVRLLNAQGREVPSFFLPFQPQPEVGAKSTEDVQLRYWLDAADLAGALRLEVKGKTIDVKGGKAFDLSSLKNKEPKTFAPGEW